jgi:DNA-binding GntR family transcriptional regulator
MVETAEIQRQAALRSQVYRAMRLRLIRGEFSMGARLQEHVLAREFNVSRTPVREALVLLANDRFIEPAGRGFVVTSLTAQDVRDVIEIHCAIDCVAAARAAEAASMDDIERLRAALRLAANEEDPTSFYDAITAFRSEWMSILKNQRLAQAMQLYEDQLQPLRLKVMLNTSRRGQMVDSLTEIVEAIARHDPTEAAAAMHRHLGRAERALLEVADD